MTPGVKFLRASGACDPNSLFWLRWAPRLVIFTLLLSLGWMVALIILADVRLDSLDNTKYAEALTGNSQKLAMAHCIFFGSTIPMWLGVFLDIIDLRKKSNDETALIHFRTRVLFLISSLAATSVYGGIHLLGSSADLHRLPYLYALSNFSARITFVATILLPILTLRIVPPMLALAGWIPLCLMAPFRLICLISPNQVLLLQLANLLLYVSNLLFTVGFFVWGRDLWARFKRSRGKPPAKMEATELLCIVYRCGNVAF
jgi:hypothetical protein